MPSAPMMIRRDNDLSNFQFYHYAPSLAAAVIFIILFGLTSGLHIYQMIRTRTWFFLPFCIGCLFELVGYIGRAMSATQPVGQWTEGPYIMQTTLLLIAPALFAASIYMELGRVSQLAEADSKLLVRRTWMTKIFVSGDVLSFFMQAGGGGLMASSKSNSTIKTGQDVVVGGLFVQIIFFGLFVVTATLFNIRLQRSPTRRSTEVPWQKHMLALYIASILILIRSVVRVVEYLQGFDGYIMTHEVFLYIFDGLLMLITTMIFNWIHPSEIRSLLVGGNSAKGFRMNNVGV